MTTFDVMNVLSYHSEIDLYAIGMGITLGIAIFLVTLLKQPRGGAYADYD